ncbi:MAG: hypothetical protein H7328_00260 [Bdellovibrio sp.]|nr:hypothetical protein [Bdellovibrio sp.]
MKALLSLTVLVLISSTSNAFCLKQYAAQMNRMAASTNKTNFYNVASKGKVAQANAGTISAVQKNK